MASQEATSKLRVGKTTDYRCGMDTELLSLASGPATLFVLCGDRFAAAQAFRAGSFSVHMIRVKRSPVAMASCMVGDHQWMLSKDSFVLRVQARRYVFALPGLLYGLALPAAASAQECRMLEEVFASFCAYRDLVGKQDVVRDPASNSSTWSHAYCEMLKLANQSNSDTCTLSRLLAATKTATVHVELTVRKKIQRAVRASAVVKLLSRSLLTGALDPRRHLHLAAAGVVSLPSLWVVVELLDAVENSHGHRSAVNRFAQQLARGQTGFWYLNTEGIGLLLNILSACGTAGGRPVKKRRLDAVMEEPAETPECSGEGVVSDHEVGGNCHGPRCCGSGNAKEVKNSIHIC